MKIDAVMESADFGPAHEGEGFVLVTLRIPKAEAIHPGTYSLEWKTIDRPAWSRPNDQDKYDTARERAAALTS